jgi:methylated-DNA-[protein]-cysteine S-methyltransferase
MKIKIIKSTPFGPVALIWSTLEGSPKIVRILLSKPGLSAEDQVSRIYSNTQMSSCAEIDAVAMAIKAFLEGNNVVFSFDVVTLELCSSFQKAVLCAEYQIPRGSVSTYQLIARYLGKENGARAVGNALAKNPFPIIVPCHRAIRSDLHIGGFQGGLDMKRALLEKEGITFDKLGRVICQRLYYDKKHL